ncbi:hypothetical protein [Streptomyces scopuliridis]|uniref:Uncharacterized protein n=1 Tax=Streptomyces scopuliridis RB72 TaxID=1440053 RepID=A0A2T7T780_9ACTN|nr:hypothetical protein [Streptomyces scopuliridis]PVE10945.1 hypothetical protein Y717_21135 [Streptomyces scopuliridis RB72]
MSVPATEVADGDGSGSTGRGGRARFIRIPVYDRYISYIPHGFVVNWSGNGGTLAELVRRIHAAGFDTLLKHRKPG